MVKVLENNELKKLLVFFFNENSGVLEGVFYGDAVEDVESQGDVLVVNWIGLEGLVDWVNSLLS